MHDDKLHDSRILKTGEDVATIAALLREGMHETRIAMCSVRRAKKICFANGNAAEVVVRRFMINRLATASQEKTQREFGSCALAKNSTKHIQSVLPTEKLAK